MSRAMSRENLWMDSGPLAGTPVIHRFRRTPGRSIPSAERGQRIEAQGVRELFTKRAVSYQLSTSLR